MNYKVLISFVLSIIAPFLAKKNIILPPDLAAWAGAVFTFLTGGFANFGFRSWGSTITGIIGGLAVLAGAFGLNVDVSLQVALQGIFMFIIGVFIKRPGALKDLDTPTPVSQSAAWVVLMFCLLPVNGAVLAQAPQKATVVRVKDGDSVVIQRQRGKRFVRTSIRLHAIDAPVRPGQPFGTDAAQYVVDQIQGKEVEILLLGYDRYQNRVGRIYVNGEDFNLKIVRAGLAWYWDKYKRGMTLEQQKAYWTAHNEAREARRGLWAGDRPIPPWQWRKGQR